MQKIRIGIVAGEASGDILGAMIMLALKDYFSQCKETLVLEFVGVAGERMQQAGANSLFSLEKLSVMGFSEVLCRARELLSLRRQIKTFFLDNPPDIYIGLDAPDFNLPIEKALKQAGILTVHVNSPTIWAWRKNRLFQIKQSVDLMLTLFPFEAQYYQQVSIPVKYIGHPLADILLVNPNHLNHAKKINAKKIIALLPGSRSGEIKHIGPVLLKAAWLFYQQHPDSVFLAPMLNPARYQQFEQQYQKLTPELPLILSLNSSHEIIAKSEVILLASGTATLEAMLLNKPMVVVYKCASVSYLLAKCLIKTPFIALPNILAGQALVPELIQTKATPKAIVDALEQYFLFPEKQLILQQHFSSIAETLRCQAAQTAAQAIAELLTV